MGVINLKNFQLKIISIMEDMCKILLSLRLLTIVYKLTDGKLIIGDKKELIFTVIKRKSSCWSYRI